MGPGKVAGEAMAVHVSDWPVTKAAKSQDPQDCRKYTETSSSLGFMIQN